MRLPTKTILIKNLEKYIKKIKPRCTKNFRAFHWNRVSEVITGLIFGQSCFINTIAENTKHFKKKQEEYEHGKREKTLNKQAQIEKISNYLLIPVKGIIQSYFSFIQKEYFSQPTRTIDKQSTQSESIEQRVYNQKLLLHDTSDLQKDYAKKMELLSPNVRDGSKSSKQKLAIGKGYLIEGSIAYYQGKIIPLLLSLYSYVNEDFMSGKEETKKNLRTLKVSNLCEQFLHVYDRGYDDNKFISEHIKEVEAPILVRGTSKRNVIIQEEYDEYGRDSMTQKDRKEIFYSLQTLMRKLTYYTHSKYPWFTITWKKIYMPGPGFPRNKEDVIPLNFVSVCIVDNEDKIEGITEDIDNNKPERAIHFYTDYPVDCINDAIFIFFCYLKRWKIETYFRYIKQVFSLEKVCVMKFQKIKNLCSLLVITTQYLYKLYGDFEDIEVENKSRTLESILKKNAYKRDDDTILTEFLYFSYKYYCKIKALTHTADSFARFIHNLMENSISYTKHIIKYHAYDTS
jgi:hypothetical protein